MSKKKFYIVFFDYKLSGSGYNFTHNINQIIEELRLVYFRNCSFKIAEHSFLIVTDENILDNYTNIYELIENIILDLTDKGGFHLVYEELELFVMVADDDKKEQLTGAYKEIKLYILER
jgi:hypothetical protein